MKWFGTSKKYLSRNGTFATIKSIHNKYFPREVLFSEKVLLQLAIIYTIGTFRPEKIAPTQSTFNEKYFLPNSTWEKKATIFSKITFLEIIMYKKRYIAQEM